MMSLFQNKLIFRNADSSAYDTTCFRGSMVPYFTKYRITFGGLIIFIRRFSTLSMPSLMHPMHRSSGMCGTRRHSRKFLNSR